MNYLAYFFKAAIVEYIVFLIHVIMLNLVLDNTACFYLNTGRARRTSSGRTRLEIQSQRQTV